MFLKSLQNISSYSDNMKTMLECIPCFLSQSLEAARMASEDIIVHQQVMQEVMGFLQTVDFTQSPPMISKDVHRIIRDITNSQDPYQTVKQQANMLAKKQYPRLRERVIQSKNPLLIAVKLAIVGNVVDFGTTNRYNLDEMIDHAFHKPFDDQAFPLFQERANKAHSILYLADNTGEVFFDKLLLEQLSDSRKKITYVVKANPIINDVTKKDAITAGIQNYAEIIEGDEGSKTSAPGMVLSNASTTLHSLLESSDMIISKGQGNYEALSDISREIFFLLMVKCPLVANDIDESLGKMVLKVKG